MRSFGQLRVSKARKAVALLAGLSILGLVLLKLDGRVWRVLLGLDISLFSLALPAYLACGLLGSLALRLLIEAPLPKLLLAHFAGMLHASVTPGRLGYYYVALSLQKAGHSFASSAGRLTLFQGVNFLVKSLLCSIALFYFAMRIAVPPAIAVSLVIFPLIIFLLVYLTLGTSLLASCLRKLRLSALLPWLRDFQSAWGEVRRKSFIALLALMCLGWAAMSLQWFFVAKSVGSDVSFLDVLMLQPLLTTLMFVPISPAGLGVAEAASALLFAALAMDPAMGAAFLLTVRLNSFLVDSIGLVDVYRSLARRS